MTGPRFLLDTNVVIGVVKGFEPARSLIDSHGAHPDDCVISQISRMELLSFSTISSAEEAVIEALLSAVSVILLDERIEQEAIALRRRCRLKLADAVIAATATVHGLTLLTLDERLGAALTKK